MTSRQVGKAVLADLVCVLVFVAVGRASHGEAVGPAGMITTAWPFTVGLLTGWVLSLAPPLRAAPPTGLVTGVIVWTSTVVVGMALRSGSGAGVQISFVVMTVIVLGAFVLGWRGVVGLVISSRRRAPANTQV